MTNIDRNAAWGFALFGDDLRWEIGGKASLMGIYQNDMFFPENVQFPITLPRLIVLIMYYESYSLLSDDVTFKVTFGKENTALAECTMLRRNFPNDEPPPDASLDIGDEESERILHVRLPIHLSPLTIPSPGRVRVRAHYSGGTTLKLGSIALRQLPQEEYDAIIGIGPNQDRKSS